MTRTLRRLLRADRDASPPLPQRNANASSWFEAPRPHVSPVGLAGDYLRDPLQVAQVNERLKPLLDDPSVAALIKRDTMPIPATEDREGYFGAWHLAYWLSGNADFRMVEQMLPPGALARVLDFGGATGRFARHVTLADDAATVTIAELSLDHVMWCDRYLSPRIRAVKISPIGYFPLADSSMTSCVGLSVFTHIDASESAWIAEIHRVLEPGGYAFLTVHSEHTWPLLPQHAGLMETLQDDPRFVEMYDPATPMPEERMVFDFKPGTMYHCCNTFAHTNYLRRCWGKWFEVAAIHPNAHHGFQTVVVLRKRD